VVVVVEGVHLAVDVRDEQVHPSVLVVVSGVDAHAGACMAFGAVANVGLRTNLFELSVAAVDEKKVCDRVVGDKEVQAAVIINIAGHHSPGFAQ